MATKLTAEFGAGFSAASLWSYRQFYVQFPILATPWRELSWSHFKLLLRVDTPAARQWYANEAVTQTWSVRALDRQVSTLFFERLLGSKDKAGLTAEAAVRIANDTPASPRDFIRDPYVLKFLGAESDAALYEQDLEQGLLNQLQKFSDGVGQGFCLCRAAKALAGRG